MRKLVFSKKLASMCPIYLAGGLNADNIIDAITTVAPLGVDLCSSVEESPGRKSKEKMETLFKILKSR